MKRLKVFIPVLLVFALALSLVSFAATPDLVIDIEAIKANEGQATVHIFGAAGYEDYVIQFGNHGSYILLGDIDLSKYDTCTIHYGADGGAKFVEDDKASMFGLTSNGAATDSAGALLATADILASAPLVNITGGWATASAEVVINIDSTYSGKVYLALKQEIIGGRADGVAITDITFSSSGEAPNTKPANPTTADVSMIFVLVATALVSLVLFKKKSFAL